MHRRYLLSYHKQSFYGFWKSILDNPPCKRSGDARNKQFSYEFETKYDGNYHELYLDLIGDTLDLDLIESQLAKYKIARLEPVDQPTSLVLIIDYTPHPSALYIFYEFCRDKDFFIRGKEIHQDGRVLKTYG
ncbi:MAG: hypothetical protein EU536_03895 [Promethearchaeota archaeon]|nr:MAG: hypothetical protein EU536_03895 [Candidatus Lokiarchaeota archaeon]